MTKKKALVFGGRGQAGRFLVPLLESKDYQVIAPTREEVDVTTINLMSCIFSFRPDEIYNLAAILPGNTWNDTVGNMLVNTFSVRKMLDAFFSINPKGRFFQASSASIFGNSTAPQNENSVKSPTTTYGVSKLAAQELVRVYREKGHFACTGIFFNMESEYRHQSYFTRKVTLGVAKLLDQIRNGVDPQPLQFGDLSGVRDWGLTKEYMEAAYLIMQDAYPNEYVVGSGVAASCLDFVRYSFDYAKLDESLFRHKTNIFTPYASGIMHADPYKIKRNLGWKANASYEGVIVNLLEGLGVVHGKSIAAR